MTGWNMPPGYNVRDIPGCGYDEPCECCGTTNLDKCICPECPVCETHGDPYCYKWHGLEYTLAQTEGQRQLASMRAIEKEWIE